jgi:hypothetical protein
MPKEWDREAVKIEVTLLEEQCPCLLTSNVCYWINYEVYKCSNNCNHWTLLQRIYTFTTIYKVFTKIVAKIRV